ncbi:hypothetical protein FV139_08240 [Parahaliea maris]|uniref:Uncharacterized protein n=1 Tax=Parahaliea maris TaxID=2716870 RepID=A0A5C9A7D7_9GAMM|nr:hypothetical protein FV139_08240 [Parahaliea maris]
MKPGAKLFSVACETEVMVIRGTGEFDLCCGGSGMATSTPEARHESATDMDGGTLIGKRYVNEDGSIELLCTKPGRGSLMVGNSVLGIKQAQALPSSD